jgi:hypothetical protein
VAQHTIAFVIPVHPGIAEVADRNKLGDEGKLGRLGVGDEWMDE